MARPHRTQVPVSGTERRHQMQEYQRFPVLSIQYLRNIFPGPTGGPVRSRSGWAGRSGAARAKGSASGGPVLRRPGPSDNIVYVTMCSIVAVIPIIRTSFRHLPTALPRTRAAGHDSSEAMTSPPQAVRCPSQRDRLGRRRPRLSDTHARRIPAPPPRAGPTMRSPSERPGPGARDLPNGSGGANFGGATFPIRPAATGFIPQG